MHNLNECTYESSLSYRSRPRNLRSHVRASNHHPRLRWWEGGGLVKFVKGSVADLEFLHCCGLRDTLPRFNGLCK